MAILEGDFALTHRAVPAPTGRDWRVSADYLALVFDDASAAPRLLATSRHGGRFRQLLNDPALPDDARP